MCAQKESKQSGQIFLSFAFMIMTMVLFLFLIVNVSNLSRERIRLQTAADACALAMATFEARLFNTIADRNFILKYPSGDAKKRFGNQDNWYPTPGIDQIPDGRHVFPSERDFYDYMRVLTPYQRQQDKFFKIYDEIIPKIGEKYMLKNDSQAKADELIYPDFDIKRKEIITQYYDVKGGQLGGGKEKPLEVLIDGWMEGGNKYMFSFVRVKKNVDMWGENFNFQAISAGDVIPFTGEIWPNPKPTYKARLAPTQEKGVFH